MYGNARFQSTSDFGVKFPQYYKNDRNIEKINIKIETKFQSILETSDFPTKFATQKLSMTKILKN